MDQLYEVRIVLEELCARRAATVGDRPGLEALRADWVTLRDEGPAAAVRGPAFVHADERFHRRLSEAAGNDVVVRTLGDLNDRIRLMRIHDFTTEDRVRATIAEHLEIVEAVLTGDADAAAAFMRAHVQRAGPPARPAG